MEPLTAGTLECLALGVPTSYKRVLALTCADLFIGAVLRLDGNNQRVCLLNPIHGLMHHTYTYISTTAISYFCNDAQATCRRRRASTSRRSSRWPRATRSRCVVLFCLFLFFFVLFCLFLFFLFIFVFVFLTGRCLHHLLKPIGRLTNYSHNQPHNTLHTNKQTNKQTGVRRHADPLHGRRPHLQAPGRGPGMYLCVGVLVY